MFKVRNRLEISQNAINDLASQSSIAQLAPGSKARAVIEAVSNVVGDTAKDISIGRIGILLPNAIGTTLDLLGDIVGIQRLAAISATVSEADQNLRYYVRTGTFGDINSSNAIVIPAGNEIRVGTDRGKAEALFIQRNDVTLTISASETFFAADQIGRIVTKGISANALTKHNFTGYADSVFQSLLVTNNRGIAGRARESDQNLRFRISNAIVSRAESNVIAMRIAALLVPGVADVKIVPNKSGLGTYDVVVFGISPVVSTSIIQEVQEQINRHQAVGMRGIAVAPEIIGISLRIRLTFKDGATAGDKNAAANAVDASIREFITEIDSGQEFILNSLVKIILESHPVIIDVGDPNRPFDELLIWRNTSLGDSRFSRNLTQNFRVRDYEEIIVEPFIDNPIQIIET